MIGIVKKEHGMLNLYVNGVCVVSTTVIAGINHGVRKYNLQGYTMVAAE
jgi:hypothetical protein